MSRKRVEVENDVKEQNVFSTSSLTEEEFSRIIERIEKTSKGETDTGKAVIKEIKRGLYKELINSKLREWIEQKGSDIQKQRLDKPAIKLVLKDKEFGDTFEEVYILATNPNGIKRSNFYKFVKKYGKPEIGKEVNYLFNEKGFKRVDL